MKRTYMPPSMKVASIWVVWGFLSLGALGWGLQVILAAVGSLKDMAAWVQAIGSIGAIIGAIYVANWQWWRDRTDTLIDSYFYMEKAFHVAVYAAEVIKGASSEIMKGDLQKPTLEYHVSLLEAALADLEEIEFTRLDDQEAADAFLAIKRATNLTRATITARLSSGGAFDGYQVNRWIENADTEIDRMSDAVMDFVESRPAVLDEVDVPISG